MGDIVVAEQVMNRNAGPSQQITDKRGMPPVGGFIDLHDAITKIHHECGIEPPHVVQELLDEALRLGAASGLAVWTQMDIADQADSQRPITQRFRLQSR